MEKEDDQKKEMYRTIRTKTDEDGRQRKKKEGLLTSPTIIEVLKTITFEIRQAVRELTVHTCLRACVHRLDLPAHTLEH